MKVLINGYPFEIKFVDGDSRKMKPDENSYNLGLPEYADAIIRIRKGMNERTNRSTVIHELTHAFMFAFGYTIEGEEAMCDFFGSQGDDIIKMADLIMKAARMKGVKMKC